MRKPLRPKASRRTKKIVLSVACTVVGIAALTAFASWLEGRRDTDLTDPTAGVTASFKNSDTVATPPIRFVDVAELMGVTMRHGRGARTRALTEDTGSGVAWSDYDNDGDWDLYIVNFPDPAASSPGPEDSNRLYRNDGDRFTDVTEEAGVGDPEGFGMGATFVDYDNDGDMDLYVTNHGPNRLYRNRGDGTFEDVAEQAGVDDPLWSTGAAWGDFDRDGHLDLYLCNYLRYDPGSTGTELFPSSLSGSYTVPFTLNPNSFDPEPNRLFHNRGDGTFEDVAKLSEVIDPEGRSLSASFCDLDGDGWLDLYVNNDVSTNRLYRNMGGDFEGEWPVLFLDLSAITGTADPRGSMGLSLGELGETGGEPDGLPDIFMTHWVAQEYAFYRSLVNAVGGLEYRDRTRRLRLGEISINTVGWGSGLVDFDLDGRIDIVVANGSTIEVSTDPRHLISEPMFLFWNAGEHFQNVAPKAGDRLSLTHNARGLAAADFDGDGDIDLAVAINRGTLMLLRNDTETTNRSLTVRLEGPDAIRFGAKVEVFVQGRLQVRWFGADVTFLGMHATEMIFGLGEASGAERVHVLWADGKETTLTGVPAGRVKLVHPTALTKHGERRKSVRMN